MSGNIIHLLTRLNDNSSIDSELVKGDIRMNIIPFGEVNISLKMRRVKITEVLEWSENGSLATDFTRTDEIKNRDSFSVRSWQRCRVVTSSYKTVACLVFIFLLCILILSFSLCFVATRPVVNNAQVTMILEVESLICCRQDEEAMIVDRWSSRLQYHAPESNSLYPG
jgi:hypothetical protein